MTYFNLILYFIMIYDFWYFFYTKAGEINIDTVTTSVEILTHVREFDRIKDMDNKCDDC